MLTYETHFRLSLSLSLSLIYIIYISLLELTITKSSSSFSVIIVLYVSPNLKWTVEVKSIGLIIAYIAPEIGFRLVA